MGTTTGTPAGTSVQRTNKGTFYFLQVVTLVSIVVATLFTAWSDPGLLPGNLGDRFSISFSSPATPTPDLQETPGPRARPFVGIVVGHWDDTTKDPGAVCSDINLTEFQVNQTIASLVRDQLIAQNIDVELLREFDGKLSGYKASALVSIHADSCDYINDAATGFKVSSALANPHPEMAARLTACLRSRYATATGLSMHNSITADMTSYHAFEETDENTPAAIIEVGFLNLDRELLTRQPERVAQGITNGILCFLNNEDITPLPSPTASPTGTP